MSLLLSQLFSGIIQYDIVTKKVGTQHAVSAVMSTLFVRIATRFSVTLCLIRPISLIVENKKITHINTVKARVASLLLYK